MRSDFLENGPACRCGRAAPATRTFSGCLLALIAVFSQAPVPSPASVLGFAVGADFELATYNESIAYFRRLDAASERLTLVEVGRTSEGRPWHLAFISSAANLAGLERHREIAQRLAHPEGLTDEQARALAREGKPIVDISGGLHASEVAGAQHSIQLAYDLITGDDDPEIAAILDNVIVMLWPSLNPDGQNIVVEWYESNLGTPYEMSGPPRLYQKYIGHDNNRDAYMLNQVESRVVARTWRHWEPQIIFVHHQSSPFPTRIWLPPFAEPIAPQVHPLMSRTVNFAGMAMAAALEERRQPGAVHMGTGFDAWYPGYIDYLPMLQNQAAWWTETAGAGYATPRLYTLQDFPQGRRDLRPESLYSSPWPGGWWRLRDAVEYMETVSIATLDYAAKYGFDLLYNRYQAGRDTIRKYRQEPPYAYVVPEDQHDPVAAVELLRRLAFNGIRVARLGRDAAIDGIDYPAGTWIVPMDQEFAELARQLLDVQRYPDLREYPEGPPEQPYDAAGWTLSAQMGVRVVAASSPLSEAARAALEAVEGAAADWRAANDSIDAAARLAPGAGWYEVEPLREGPAVVGRDAAPFDSVPGLGFDTNRVAAGIVPPAGGIAGAGEALAVDAAHNNAFRAVNAAWRAGATVAWEPGAAGTNGQPGSSGRYLIRGLDPAAARQLVDSLALRAERTSARGIGLERPRIGVFRPWSPSMDEGWSRWLLEQYGFDFTGLRPHHFRAEPLRQRFDVIVLADYGSNQIIEGLAVGSVPGRYAGGIGEQGVRALDRFVREGGTLVCMNGSTSFAIEHLRLPVRDLVADARRDEFFGNGSILEVAVDPSHPVMSGMPARANVFFDRSPVFTVEEGFEGAALAKYQETGTPLVSGYLLGDDKMNGFAAALDVRKGAGHVILIGFRPQWRGQPFGTFRVLFNAALFAGEVAAEAPASTDFWKPPEREEEHARPEEDGEEPAGGEQR
ncbi:MAG TPA: M14 family zinc carboxypeptidase [Acidobacteriota bacterium]